METRDKQLMNNDTSRRTLPLIAIESQQHGIPVNLAIQNIHNHTFPMPAR